MDRSGLRHTSEKNIIISLSPCVCNTPVGGKMVPVPYMIISRLDWSKRTISNVRFGEEESFTMSSRTSTVEGNEPGTGGGVSSGVHCGWCRPRSNKTDVLVNGRQVIQDNCIFEMNCDGPDGNYNTLGRISYSDKRNVVKEEKRDTILKDY